MTDPREVLSRPAPPPDQVLRYGAGPDHVVDLRLPAGPGPHPLVVVVHGGFWRAAYDRAHTGAQCAGLAAAGYAVATVEYRRTGQPGGGWPGTFADLAAVTDALPALLGPAVDPDRVVLLGHSAGGHLAVWAAARHRLPADSPWHRDRPLPVRGVVSLAGVVDLELAAELQLDTDAVSTLLGGSPTAQPARYAAADPVRLVPAGVRTVLLHGTEDVQVPVAVSRSFAAAAQTAGDPVELRELAGVEHFGLIDPLSAAWPAVLAALAELVGAAPVPHSSG